MPMSLRLPDVVETRLSQLAARTGRSKTYYATQAIIDHIDDLEDLYLAQAVAERVRDGREKTTPLAQLIAEYGVED